MYTVQSEGKRAEIKQAKNVNSYSLVVDERTSLQKRVFQRKLVYKRNINS